MPRCAGATPSLLAGVSPTLPLPCAGTSACACAVAAGRSLYNYAYDDRTQKEREREATAAHVVPDLAEALLGVPLSTIGGLAASARMGAFRCVLPEASAPSEDAMASRLGALAPGDAYFVPDTPLEPGKEMPTRAHPKLGDWYTQAFEATAFVDNLRDVPTFLTRGDRDLVVPERTRRDGSVESTRAAPRTAVSAEANARGVPRRRALHRRGRLPSGGAYDNDDRSNDVRRRRVTLAAFALVP